mmetsp:Transcript_17244/g.35588  ORF Transcript_17244/g.35588 Transcript_17244/m.35588 type:complete len:259 (-) Transcript_17244:330-1106(-)
MFFHKTHSFTRNSSTMTTGQQSKKTLSSSYSNGMASKACSLRKKGLSLPTSTLRPWKPGMSAVSKTQSTLLISSSGSTTNKSTNKMKRTVSPVLGSSFITSEFALKQGTPIVISTPGVYFENRRLYDTRHPAQAMHNPFLVSKMPTMPIGTPLAKPPCLAFAKSGPLPFGVPSLQPARSKSPPTKTVDESFLRPNKTSLHTRRVSMDKTCEEDGEMEVNPSNGIRNPSKNNASISNKVLSKEERVFLEAATLLSAAKI